MESFRDALLQTNPFALLTIAEACEHSSIVASRDIVDWNGAKLWARDLRVTPALHQRLIRRKLQYPLETSLRVEDGVTADTLAQDLRTLLDDGADPLHSLILPCSSHLIATLARVELHPVAQLLLTAAQQVQPGSYQHAVRAMALAGALAWHSHAPGDFMHGAMLAGLLHDLGEMYVNPRYLETQRALDLDEYRQLAAHPHVGALLLTQMTDYPEEIARAVHQHHERLDGTGYPAQLLGSALSPLGQMLAVVELVLGVADEQPGAAARAAFALKFVPGELSGHWSGPVTSWAGTEPPPWHAATPPVQARNLAGELAPLDGALQRMQGTAETIAGLLDGPSQRVALRAVHRLSRLRVAWNAMGLWSLPEPLTEPRERFDVDLAVHELRYRISMIGRDCLWPETDLAVLADARLVPLWTALQSIAAAG